MSWRPWHEPAVHRRARERVPGRRASAPSPSRSGTRWPRGACITTRGRTSGRLTFPPKPFCPYDWGREVEWVDLSGRGKLYSQTVIHAAPAAFAREAPIRNGIVDLDEGLRVAARILGEPALDAAMECVVLRYADGPLFAFRAVDG